MYLVDTLNLSENKLCALYRIEGSWNPTYLRDIMQQKVVDVVCFASGGTSVADSRRFLFRSHFLTLIRIRSQTVKSHLF